MTVPSIVQPGPHECHDLGARGVYCRAACSEGAERRTHAASGTPLARLGRPEVHAGPYCEAHGGGARAVAEVDGSWTVLAPDAVGDEAALRGAGAMSLETDHAYVVVREELAHAVPTLYRVCASRADRDRIATLGAKPAEALWTGRDRGAAERVSARLLAKWGVVAAVEIQGATTQDRGRPWLVHLGLGTHLDHIGAYGSRQDAVAAGVAAWRQALAGRVDAVTAARGGTLSWGAPIAPLAEPHVLQPAPDESGWDVAQRTPRIAPVGYSVITGLRASGEAA